MSVEDKILKERMKLWKIDYDNEEIIKRIEVCSDYKLRLKLRSLFYNWRKNK